MIVRYSLNLKVWSSYKGVGQALHMYVNFDLALVAKFSKFEKVRQLKKIASRGPEFCFSVTAMSKRTRKVAFCDEVQTQGKRLREDETDQEQVPKQRSKFLYC